MNMTSIFVTHNLKEVILMDDCIVHIQKGRLYTFRSIEEFVESDKTGVQEEFDFWSGLKK